MGVTSEGVCLFGLVGLAVVYEVFLVILLVVEDIGWWILMNVGTMDG